MWPSGDDQVMCSLYPAPHGVFTVTIIYFNVGLTPRLHDHRLGTIRINSWISLFCVGATNRVWTSEFITTFGRSSDLHTTVLFLLSNPRCVSDCRELFRLFTVVKWCPYLGIITLNLIKLMFLACLAPWFVSLWPPFSALCGVTKTPNLPASNIDPGEAQDAILLHKSPPCAWLL